MTKPPTITTPAIIQLIVSVLSIVLAVYSANAAADARQQKTVERIQALETKVELMYDAFRVRVAEARR